MFQLLEEMLTLPYFETVFSSSSFPDSSDRRNWDFLYARYENGGSALTQDEATNLLAGLGCSRDPDILSDYLDMNLNSGK